MNVTEHEMPNPNPPNAIERLWRPIGREALITPPPPRKWLLRLPTKSGEPCDPDFGDGMLPLSKAGVLSSAGGVGKSQLLLQLGAAIITDHPWLGYFPIGQEARGKRVLLAFGEEDDEEIHRRVYDVCQALCLSNSEIDLVANNLVALGLAGEPVAMLTRDMAGTYAETPEMLSLRQRLTDDAGPGWALVALDPLSRWCGPDTESDNAAATRTVQALESLVRVPGGPTVLVAAHSSKMSRREGGADTRGVTGITDGLRWEAQLRVQDADVYFKQAKSNYSRPMVGEIQLVRDECGVLRVATVSDVAERQDNDNARVDAALEKNVEKLLAALRAKGPAVSKAIAIRWARLGTGPGRLAFDESVSRGLIVNRGTSRAPQLCVCNPPVPPESASPRDCDSETHGLPDSVRQESARVRESAKHWTEANDAA